MKRKKPTLLLLAIVSLGLLWQSCATIVANKNNTLVFTGEGAPDVQVFIDDSLVGTAPGKLILQKQLIQHGSKLEIRADGYKTQEYLILRKPHTGYVLVNFVVGAVPLAVDYATGSIMRPQPRKFEIDLEKVE